MLLNFAHYLSGLRNRIPLKECLGCYPAVDMMCLYLIFADILKYFLTACPLAMICSESIKYICAITVFIVFSGSDKWSIIEELSEILPAKKKGMGIYRYMLSISIYLYFFNSFILYEYHQHELSTAIACTVIVNVPLLLFLYAQYRILKGGDEYLERVAERRFVK